MGLGTHYGTYALGYSDKPCHVSKTIERKDIEDHLNSLHLTLDELNDHYNDYVKEDVDVEEVGDCKYKVTQTTRTAEDLTMSLSEYREKFMAYYDRYVTAPTKEMDEKKAAVDSADKKVKKADSEISSIENEISAISASIASLEK
jgi:chromosome segregation ATPase